MSVSFTNKLSQLFKRRNRCFKGTIFLLTLLAVPWTTLASGEVELQVSARQVAVDKSFELYLTAAGRVAPDLISMPNDLQILSVGTQSMQSNQRVYSSRIYTVSISTPGVHKIGPLRVQVGNREFETNEVSIQVLAPERIQTPSSDGNKKVSQVNNSSGNENVSLDAIFFGRAELPDNRTTYYVGEEIPLVLKLYVDNRFQRKIDYPRIDAGKALFADYGRINRDNSIFAPVSSNRAQSDDHSYEVYVFQTRFRTLAPGKLTMKAEQAVALLMQTRNNRSLFGSSYQEVPYNVVYELPELTIQPLPTPPKDTFFTGLVGDWQITGKIAEKQVRQGEAVALEFVINGVGALDNLIAPTLSVADCRVYPPEVAKSPGRFPGEAGAARISYVLIPQKQDPELPIKMALCSFDPVSGKYRTEEFAWSLTVSGVASVSGVVATPADNQIRPDEGNTPREPRNTILGIKHRQSGQVSLPLWPPSFWWFGWFLLGPALWLFSILWRRRVLKQAGDSAYLRKRSANKRYSQVLKLLSSCPVDELPKNVNEALVPLLADCWNQPPGATASELAKLPEAGEAQEALSQIGELDYSPLPPDETTLETWRKSLIAMLKKSLLWLLIFVGMAIGSLDAVAKEAKPSWNEAAKLAVEGEYKQSGVMFRELQSEHNDQGEAALLYNLGCVAYLENRPELALWYFEQAYLLQPTDYEIQENLNVLRRKFFQSEVGVINHPKDLAIFVITRLRPDQYAWLILAIWTLAWGTLIVRRRLSAWMLGSLLGVWFFMIAAGVGAIVYELNGPYSSSLGMVVTPRAVFYRLPNVKSEVSDGSVAGGAKVELLEKHGDFRRIREGNRDGWVKNSEVKELTPNSN